MAFSTRTLLVAALTLACLVPPAALLQPRHPRPTFHKQPATHAPLSNTVSMPSTTYRHAGDVTHPQLENESSSTEGDPTSLALEDEGTSGGGHIKISQASMAKQNLLTRSNHPTLQPHPDPLGLPPWLPAPTPEVLWPRVEAGIEAVFRNVAGNGVYGPKTPRVNDNAGRRDTTGTRYERTTALSDAPDYVADGRDDGGTLMPEAVPSSQDEAGMRLDPTLDEYEDIYDLHEGHRTDSQDDQNDVNIGPRGDTGLDDNPSTETTEVQELSTTERAMATPASIPPQSTRTWPPPMSWFDALLCSRSSTAWMLANFLLGFLFFVVALVAPARLATLRACTPLLPRTHFVTVHLLVFVAASFKCMYLFHLTFGGPGRLPLLLLLILTNTSVLCVSSALLLIVLMMFLAPDVQVFKPKLMTVYNVSILVVMKLSLGFIADVIVGSAHSKAVLVISRLLMMCIVVGEMVFFLRRHQRVVAVAEGLRREFQGEMKLLVAPGEAQGECGMGQKHLLRQHLGWWCEVAKVCAVGLVVVCVTHMFHAVFLVSANVPAWAWWLFHVVGCLAECVLCCGLFVAAALMQWTNHRRHFLHNFFLPSSVFQRPCPPAHRQHNGDVYQRVSYSSATDTTQYASGPSNANPQVDTIPTTPRVPKQRTATVRRSATFSHAPHVPVPPQRPYDPPPHPYLVRAVVRAGSTSQIPIYGPASLALASPYPHTSTSTFRPLAVDPASASASASASMLVHEDGFVRIRTGVDPRESYYSHRPANHHFHSQHPYERPHYHHNGVSRHYSFYESLPRRRRLPSRSASVRVNNIEEHPESSPEPHYRPHNIAPLHHHPSPSRTRTSRDSLVKHLNIETEDGSYRGSGVRRSSSRGQTFQPMNNLDRDDHYHHRARRKMSREDNNDPIHLADAESPSPGAVNIVEPVIDGSLDIGTPYDKHGVNLYAPTASPATRHKISNYGVPAPVVPEEMTIRGYYKPTSPGSPQREARYPRLFSERGSSTSLTTEEPESRPNYPRTNPLRRNHSSAGYFSRPLSTQDSNDRRFSSLRLSQVRKRQAGQSLRNNTSKLLSKYRDMLPRRSSISDTPKDAKTDPNVDHPLLETNVGVKKKEQEENGRPVATRTEENMATEGDKEELREEEETEEEGKESSGEGKDEGEGGKGGKGEDWALELIKSSSILTDFYAIEEPQEPEEPKEPDTQ